MSALSKNPEEEVPSEKAYIDFYKNNQDVVLYRDLKHVCRSYLNFVLNEPSEKLQSVTNKSDANGWSTDLKTIYNALLSQQTRAVNRFQSYDQILFHLITREPSSTVSNCIQQQILQGCFGLFNAKSENTLAQLYYYLDGIQSAPIDVQEKIRTVVHGIYEFLIHSLRRQVINNSDNKQLLLTTVFSLSTSFKSNDLSLVINNDLLHILSEMVCVSTVPGGILSKCDMLSIAALRLIHILATASCVNSKKIDLATLENVLNILHQLFIKILEDFNENFQNFSNYRNSNCLTSSGKQLGDFLLFLRTISSSQIMKKLLASKKWIIALLAVLDSSNICISYATQLKVLRCKLLILQLLQSILPDLQSVHIDDDLRKFVVNKLFNQLGQEIWNVPNKVEKLKSDTNFKDVRPVDFLIKEDEGNIPIHDMGFDVEKCYNCSIEGTLTLVHGTGGRGYGLGLQVIKSGCYQWKILIVKENRGNEGTCIGVSKYPVKDFSHRSTSDMWLYRAYSGSLYHNGERDMSFQSYTQGKIFLFFFNGVLVMELLINIV